MSTTFNPEIAALRDKVEAQRMELAEIRGSLHQLDKIIGATVRQSIWQLNCPDRHLIGGHWWGIGLPDQHD